MSQISLFTNHIYQQVMQRVNLKTNHSLIAILGNESGDMDSVITSIYLSVFLKQLNKHSSIHKYYIPLLNFSSFDLSSRKDVEHALSKHHIKQLIFTDLNTTPLVNEMNALNNTGDSICLSSSFLSNNIDELILVDHNRLNIHQEVLLGHLVTRIIDHHEDEDYYTSQTNSNVTNIEKLFSKTSLSLPARFRCISPCGSCASMITLLFKEKQFSPPDPLLLLYPILLDTSGLTIQSNKLTSVDIDAADFLLTQYYHSNCSGHNLTLPPATPTIQGIHQSKEALILCQDIYKSLKSHRNIDNLTISQVLKLDAKIFQIPVRYSKSTSALLALFSFSSVPGIPSVFKTANSVAISHVLNESNGQEWIQTITQLSSPNIHATWVLMYHNKSRYLVVVLHSKDKQVHEFIRQFLILHVNTPMGVEDLCIEDTQINCETVEVMHCKYSKNTSRKKIIPLLRQFTMNTLT